MDKNKKIRIIICWILVFITSIFKSSTIGSIAFFISGLILMISSYPVMPHHIILDLILKIVGKIVRGVQMDKIDFEKDKDYYRDLLKINSPLILGFIDKLDIDKNIIVAEILYLKNEKIIDIKDGKIVKLKNYECMNIMYSQRIFLDLILDGKFNGYDLDKLKDVVGEEVKAMSLAKELKFIKEGSKELVLLILSFVLAFWAALEIVKEIPFFKIILGIFAAIGYFITIYFFGRFAIFLVERKYIGDLHRRTVAGKEINKKLEGLKSYLKDYSMLSKRESKEIELWDDYLIYSVMFGQNRKIIEEYEKYIEISE